MTMQIQVEDPGNKFSGQQLKTSDKAYNEEMPSLCQSILIVALGWVCLIGECLLHSQRGDASSLINLLIAAKVALLVFLNALLAASYCKVSAEPAGALERLLSHADCALRYEEQAVRRQLQEVQIPQREAQPHQAIVAVHWPAQKKGPHWRRSKCFRPAVHALLYA